MSDMIEKKTNEEQNISTVNAISYLGKLMDDALLEIDLEHYITDANPAAKRLLGDNLIGSFLNKRINYKDLKDELKTSIKENKIIEFTSTPTNNKYHQLRGRLMPINAQKVAVLLMDMTLQHNLEKMRRDFIANVSHELRSPLTSVIGFIETIQNTTNIDEKNLKRFLQIMEDESKRMSRLIDDLLSLSRVEADEHIAPTGKVCIKSVLESVISTFNDRATKSGHLIELIDNRNDLLEQPIIRGEVDEITEVFHNLLDNALKYSFLKSSVKIKITDTVTREIIVDITNKGEGIEEKHIERLTERFYRVDKGRSRQMGGTGLGLAIVKHIVNKHRGHLHITSEPKKHTNFRVVIPKSNSLLSNLENDN
ncbi:MAG: hypothetical protein CL560_03185 [Alphaproteobacteria bacterium]|nr:hypothetical protein [Alphaproteobacteria bacterium]